MYLSLMVSKVGIVVVQDLDVQEFSRLCLTKVATTGSPFLHPSLEPFHYPFKMCPSFEVQWIFVSALTNSIWQKGYYVTSKVRP